MIDQTEDPGLNSERESGMNEDIAVFGHGVGRAASATEHALAMEEYITVGKKKAQALKNRGPIKLGGNGKLSPQILDAYWEHGFYVFENMILETELAELRADMERVLKEASVPGSDVDGNKNGEAELHNGFAKPSYRFCRPLSDPLGGTTRNKGRHPVKMETPMPSTEAPHWVLQNLNGNLQLMDSCLRLYGHPGLLSVAEAINGSDFVPYNEVTFIKKPGLGPSVAWHQDGTTHWGSQDWDQGAHGFNFMVQLYPSTAGNSVWVLPGSHKMGKLDIAKKVLESGSERIEGAVPLLAGAGDVIVNNRQMLHGSFANTSNDLRITLNEGFFPRERVLNVKATGLNGEEEVYDEERIKKRSGIIALAIDARRQHFSGEAPYVYKPLEGEEDKYRWTNETRESILKNYNLLDMYI